MDLIAVVYRDYCVSIAFLTCTWCTKVPKLQFSFGLMCLLQIIVEVYRYYMMGTFAVNLFTHIPNGYIKHRIPRWDIDTIIISSLRCHDLGFIVNNRDNS